MTLTNGFFDSSSGDRIYSSEDFTKYFGPLVQDGCMPNSTGFLPSVNPTTIGDDPPSILIEPGTAYLKGYWIHNSDQLTYFLGESQILDDDYKFLVYFKLDTNIEGRALTIETLASTDPVIPEDDAGVYYMPLAYVINAKTEQPSLITDQRLNAGVTAESVVTDSLVDECVTHDKLASDAVGTENLIDAEVTTVKLSDNAVTLEKLSPALYIPRVTDTLNLSPAGTFIPGTATVLLSPSINMVAMMHASLYDDAVTTESGRLMLSVQFKENGGSWTYISPTTVSVINASKAGCVFAYAFNLTAGRTYQFRVVAQAAGAAQTSVAASIFGMLLPR